MNSSRSLLLCALAACCAMVVCGGVGATTFHVSPQGSNTPPFDSYATAAHGVADAVFLTTGHGDTVLVHAGEYDIDTTIDLPMGVTLAGVGRDSVRLVWRGPEKPSIMFRVYGDTEIWGISFENPSGLSQTSSAALFQTVSTGRLTVHHCRFYRAAAETFSTVDREFYENEFEVWNGTGLHSTGGQHIWIHDNRFLGGVANLGAGHGVIITGGTALIEDNVFDYRPTEGRGVPIEIDRFPKMVVVRNNLVLGGCWAIYWTYSTGRIVNNTFVGASARFGAGGITVHQDANDTLEIANNIMLDFGAVPQFGSFCSTCPPTGPILYAYNALWPPAENCYTIHAAAIGKVNLVDSANVFAYPMVAYDTGCGLQAGSPLIDAGDPSEVDVDGSRSDMGWTGGPGGLLCEYSELPPLAPGLFWPEGESTRVTVIWSLRPEADLSGYHVYRGTVPGFYDPSTSPVLIAEIVAPDTLFADILAPQPDTVYYVVTAIDTAGLESDASEERVYAVSRGTNHPPEVPPLYSRVIIEGGSLQFELVATDADGDSLFFVAGPLPDHAQLTDNGDGTATFVFYPDYAQAGRYTVDVVVSDGMLADTTTVWVQVNARNGPPQFTPIGVQTVAVGGQLTIPVAASDPDGDNVILSAEDLPANASFVDHGDGTGAFAFSPDSTQAGEYTVRLIASDGQKADTLALSVAVTEPSSPSLPRIPRIVRSYPNPFNSATLIEVYIPNVGASPAPVELSVYDTIGRHVGVIFRGELAPGTHALPWDGTANGGQSLASGVYFVRLNVWSRVFGSGHKIVLLK